jgi:hypothetical protein
MLPIIVIRQPIGILGEVWVREVMIATDADEERG